MSNNILGQHRTATAFLLLFTSTLFPAATIAFSNSHHQRIALQTAKHQINIQQYRGRHAASGILFLYTENEIDTNININSNNVLRPILSAVTTASLALALTTNPISPQPAHAYEESDYASETVTNVVAQLKSNEGNVEIYIAVSEIPLPSD